MAGKLETKSAQVKAAVRNQVRKDVPYHAVRIKEHYRRLVPQPPPNEVGKGYATGALRASAYVSTEARPADDYERSYTIASRYDKGRLLRRGQLLPVAIAPQEEGKVQALVGVPVTYAVLIESGFYHAGAKRYVVAQLPLWRSVLLEEKDFFRSLQNALKMGEDVRVLSKAEKIEAALQEDVRRAQFEEDERQRDLYSIYKTTSYYPQRERRLIGATKAGRPKYRLQDVDEWRDAVSRGFREFMEHRQERIEKSGHD